MVTDRMVARREGEPTALKMKNGLWVNLAFPETCEPPFSSFFMCHESMEMRIWTSKSNGHECDGDKE